MVFIGTDNGFLLVLLCHFFQKSFPGGYWSRYLLYFLRIFDPRLCDPMVARHQRLISRAMGRRFTPDCPSFSLYGLAECTFYLYLIQTGLIGIRTQIAAVFGFVTNFYEDVKWRKLRKSVHPHLFIHTWVGS